MTSSSCGKRASDEEWLKHKFTIERMFVGEKKSLVETRQRLENDGFLVTKAQLEYKLKLWGFRRRVPKTKSDAIWQFIGRRIQRRKEQGKETEVMLGKEIFDAAKVCKEVKRHQETTVARFSQPSPLTPEGLEISFYTPAPLSTQSFWPTSLPWTRFQDIFSLLFSAPDLFKKMNNISKELRCREEDPSFTNMLRSVAPQYAAGSSLTQLAAEIGSIMPETHEKENLVRASRILQGTADERYNEYVKMILYKISNNHFSAIYLPFSSDHASFKEWESVTEMLETSGIMKAPLQLGNITDATMTAIMEKLFQQAVKNLQWEIFCESLEQSSNGRIINWLLQSGQNPDIRIHQENGFVKTPLQIAAGLTSMQLMSRLLDHGACPDLSYELWDECNEYGSAEVMHPLLETVFHYKGFDEGRLDMIERLLKMGSNISMDSIIRMMMKCRRYVPELMEALIRNGADIFQSIKAPNDAAWFIDTFSVIACTVKYSCEPKKMHPFFRLLEDAGIHHHSQIPEALDTTSIVLLAAAAGNTALLGDLQSYGVDITATGNLGSSAIHVAAYYGHLETCEKLVVECYAPLNAFEFNKQIPSPLHFAVAGRSLDIVRLFHQSKIDVNEVFEGQQEEWSAFWGRKLLWREADQRIFWLECSFTAVDVALEFSGFDIVRYLLENGAKAPSWGACAIIHYRNDDKTQDLAKLALKAGADPSFGVFTTSGPPPVPICFQFREAMKDGNIVLAQQLVLDAQEDDLWNDPHMSILESALITCHKQTVEKTFAQNPGAYEPGAVCAKVLFSSSSRDNITIRQLLSNRPDSEETSPLEALAIGLAAWSDQTEVLKLLLAEFHQPVLAQVPEELHRGLPRFSVGGLLDKFSWKGLPFWHRTYDLPFVSPIIFALWSREALSLMLNHGYRPDRFTMRAAIVHFDLDIIKMLAMFPRLSNDPDYIQGPLSYAVMHKKYDVVRFLLQNGEDVNENNYHVFSENEVVYPVFSEENGFHFSIGNRDSARSPLQSAVENSDLYLVDLLLKFGADVNAPAARNNGATALQLAAITGRLGILRTLIEHGADVNAPGAEYGGRTALEGAAEHGRIDAIQYLLSTGARTTDSDHLQYIRAIRFAQIEAHEVAENLLRGQREWTTDDHILWTALESLNRWQLECFKEETQEIPSSSKPWGDNMGVKDSEVEVTSTKDGSGHLGPKEDIYDPSGRMQPFDDLQDLEIRTSDPLAFMIGEM